MNGTLIAVIGVAIGVPLLIVLYAAGYAADDAVIGVTRGCAERLTREELQGVLAHEFSHILNGDSKISMRVMGVLFGILLLGLVGQLMFRTLAFSGRPGSRRDSDSGRAYMAIMLITLALIVLGFIGTFIGNLIKAAIARQRERLAHASPRIEAAWSTPVQPPLPPTVTRRWKKWNCSGASPRCSAARCRRYWRLRSDMCAKPAADD